MSNHVYSSIYYHLVWGTKNLEPYITEKIKDDLYKYIGRTASKRNWHLLAIGGTQDHIHILLQKGPVYDISKVVRDIKTNSGKFLRDSFDSSFTWQRGYGVFTVDSTSLLRLKKYIENQEEHYKNKRSFEKEFARMLLRYNAQGLQEI